VENNIAENMNNSFPCSKVLATVFIIVAVLDVFTNISKTNRSAAFYPTNKG
jgi:hypothetical protein